MTDIEIPITNNQYVRRGFKSEWVSERDVACALKGLLKIHKQILSD